MYIKQRGGWAHHGLLRQFHVHAVRFLHDAPPTIDIEPGRRRSYRTEGRSRTAHAVRSNKHLSASLLHVSVHPLQLRQALTAGVTVSLVLAEGPADA